MRSVKFLVFLGALRVGCVPLNDRPIIGILSEEFSDHSRKSFITSPYVKFVEAGGARAVPILVFKSEEYYRDILNKVNGVLFPGGGDLFNSTGYGRAGKIIFDLAVQMNDAGDYFPLWGTCLGFELLNFATLDGDGTWMERCEADDLASNIHFAKDFAAGRMFSNLPVRLKEKMETENLTIHLHHWCITPENYSASGLDRHFRILAVNADSKNNTFVSVIEAFEYPFYGVTFHPEKAVFDWTDTYRIPIPHRTDAVQASHFFGNFFTQEARKSCHRYPSKREEDSSLIYNFTPERDESASEPSAQMYVFRW